MLFSIFDSVSNLSAIPTLVGAIAQPIDRPWGHRAFGDAVRVTSGPAKTWADAAVS
eukprot:gene9755-16029_t